MPKGISRTGRVDYLMEILVEIEQDIIPEFEAERFAQLVHVGCGTKHIGMIAYQKQPAAAAHKLMNQIDLLLGEAAIRVVTINVLAPSRSAAVSGPVASTTG